LLSSKFLLNGKLDHVEKAKFAAANTDSRHKDRKSERDSSCSADVAEFGAAATSVRITGFVFLSS